MTLRPPTAEQRDAADPACSVWVSASAGSGKTQVLTDRVLNLLLTGTRADRILCLTFTNAAAAEMAKRLGERLARWAAMADAPLAEEIAALRDEVSPALLRRARRLFAAVVDDEGGVRIQTLHGFCQSVLRRFPLEAGVAPQFELIEERAAAALLADVRDAVLAEAQSGADPALAAALDELTPWLTEVGLAPLIAEAVSERARVLALVERHGGVAGVRADLHRAMAVEASIPVDEGCDFAGLRRAADAMAAGGKTDKGNAATMQRWLASAEGRVALWADYRDVFLTKEGAVRKTLATVAVMKACPEAQAVLPAEAARVLALEDRLRAALVAATSAALLTLAHAIIVRYERRKASRGQLDYDDLVLRTSRLLRAVGATWVLYKLDGGIDHVLIDEAQDTNADQWAVVDALTDDFFSGEDGRVPPRTIFAVGDPKQSIFSFQRADPARFAVMRERFRTRITAWRYDRWRDVQLDLSFRSIPAVLDAVDTVFAGAARAGVAEEIRHTAHRQGHGMVEVWPTVMPDEAEATGPLPPQAYGTSASPQARLATVIAYAIKHWIDTGEPLAARGRAIRAGDIMVLVRRRTPFVRELVKQLKTLGVPVAGVDRMALLDQIAVLDVLALARVLLLPEDDLTLAAVLKGPLLGLDENQLFALAHGRGGASLWQRLAASDDPQAGRAHRLLVTLMGRADFVAPYELFAHILGPLGMRARLVARLGPDANDPLDELLTLALRYARLGAPSLQGFLHWLDAGESEIKRDLEQGARDEVRIITVHGAKGLQAPVVILPDTVAIPTRKGGLLWRPEADPAAPPHLVWTPRRGLADSGTDSLWRAAADRELEEYRRLLYVAMTRAEDRLYVCGWESRRPAQGSWYQFVREALGGRGAPIEVDLTRFSRTHGWRGEGLRFEGAPPPAAASGAPVPADKPPAEPPLPSWLRVPVAREALPTAVAPSRGDAARERLSPLAADQGRRFRRGLLIHRLLESLPGLAADAREPMARRFLAAPAHGLTAAEQDDIAGAVAAILADPALAALHEPGSRAEVPLAGMAAGRAVAGRIDRLCIAPDRVLVLDYKSQRPPPAEPAGVPSEYLRQMAVYRALLRGIYPDRAVTCALLWTETPRLMPLPDALLDAHLPA